MKIIVQLLLIATVLVVMARLLRSSGQRTQALRRIATLAFAGLAVLSILFPGVWNQAARVVGVGRGSDLILYGLVAAFFSFIVTTYVRLRDVEYRYTKLARSIALQQTYSALDVRDAATQHPRPTATADPRPTATADPRPSDRCPTDPQNPPVA